MYISYNIYKDDEEKHEFLAREGVPRDQEHNMI